MLRLVSLLLFSLLAGCSVHRYDHSRSNYTLQLCVEARGLDYSSTMGFVRSMACSGNFGHAWICLAGPPGIWTGGHSGELGRNEATYFEGVMKLIDAGDPNPIRYLWGTLHDGYCEKGSGRHIPTYTMDIEISELQYWQIVELIQNYPFQEYRLSDQQCCSFVIAVARLVGVELDAATRLEIDPVIIFRGERLPLWEDETYRYFDFCSPEALEASMRASSPQTGG